MGTIRYCKKCGATLPDGVNVCPSCGALQTGSSKSVLSAIIIIMLVTALLGASFFITLKDINKESERFFENNNGNHGGDEGGNNPAVSHGAVVVSRDFSSPGWEEFDYAVESSDVRIVSTSEGYVIEADIRNLGLCEARSNYGWWSSEGRSCWGEWDFEFNDSELRNILNKDPYLTIFGGKLEGSELKTAPRGFDKEHPAIDLIRKKGFIAVRNFNDKEVMSSDFINTVADSFQALRPFFDYMSDVLTTNLNGESLID